jgi:hypothetical protein
MFAGKARAVYPKMEYLKYLGRVGRLAKNKHSSLFQAFINYARKRIITLGPG